MLEFRCLGQHLVKDGRLTSDHVRVIERRNITDRTKIGEFERVTLGVVVTRFRTGLVQCRTFEAFLHFGE